LNIEEMATKRDNKELDRIGEMLVKRAAISDAELDALVAKPMLFKGVADKIKHEPKLARRFSFRAALAYASVSLTVAVVAATASVYMLSRPVAQVPVVASKVDIPASRPETVVPQPGRPPQDVVEVSTKPQSGRGDRQYVMASDRTTVPQPQRAVSARPVQAQPEEDPDFYAVSYAGRDSLAGGRIVRVDLPRAQAFALGLPVSLENDSDTVRADLLIGPDGVPRGARLVK
jgi:hypothetical protein